MKHLEYTVHLVPNLIQHTLVGMEIGRFHELVNPKYTAEYEDWIPSKLKNLPDLQKISGVSSTTWFALLYQIPAYLAEDNLSSLLDVYDALAEVDTIQLIQRFPDKYEIIERFIPASKFDTYVGYSGAPPAPWPSIIRKFANAVSHTYESLYSIRWERILPELLAKEKILSEKYVNLLDWIDWWEQRTNLVFPYDVFQIELIDPVRTMGTSILADRDGFYAGASPEKISNNVSHEIGTHIMYNTHAILSDEAGPQIEENLERYLRTVEVLSWALNRELHQEQQLDWTMENALQWIETRDKVAAIAEKHRDESFLHALAEGFSLMKV
ncbi:MAG: hypothetical protein BAJATHORv1_100055 [Candidatus Thorarchaeota archaeon]|nr:MAG: hypothetical protein BAJATHORv1_100055 [Candidatus Thorarchaeota archaeon]